MVAKRSSDLIRLAQSALDRGATLTGAGNEAGVARATIQRMLSEGVITDARRPQMPKMRGPIVPKWVPHDLRADFLDNRRLYGEIHAARLARVAKAEVARAEI